MIKELLASAFRPKELKSLFKLKYLNAADRNPYSSKSLSYISKLEQLDFCYGILHNVSRSFAAVIQQLPTEIRDAICLFYLVLRGLDSIEDDMTIPLEQKKKLLISFYEKNFDQEWNYEDLKGSSDGYKLLLEKYPQVSYAFSCLEPKYQEVITDICMEMGKGMSYFAENEISSLEDYNLYCRYVAGLVGVGLSRIFSLSGLENAQIAEQTELSHSMGLFLQKTNIIRDIHEDLMDERSFWPEAVWRKYADSPQALLKKPISKNSLHCLNDLIAEALLHASDCIVYLSQIKHPQIFKFCAIPQVMAIATLKEVYNNPQVFRKNVKIRKGQAARLILETNSIDDVKKIFKEMAQKIYKKVSLNDPNSERTISRLSLIINDKPKEKHGKLHLNTMINSLPNHIQQS